VAIAQVPFVDSLNTMLDASLPLTVGEYEEWGDPSNEVYYRYMRSYAPYEQVGPRNYPDVLATGGINDPRVPFWEPTKWVARLRDHRTNDRVTLLRMQMEAGHGGASGRYDRFREVAEVQAFIMDRLGMEE
jgi:oligopeptidase B